MNIYKIIEKIKERYMTLLKYISLVVLVGTILFACSSDDTTNLNPGDDTRIEGKDMVVVLHVNPKTGEEYTEEELAELDYDPSMGEFYTPNQKIELFVWMQQKPEKVEIIPVSGGEPIAEISSFKRDDRPDIGDYKDGYGYSGKWKTKIDDLGIPLDDKITYEIKVTYQDVGIDGFMTPSVRSTSFVINHYDDGGEGIDLQEALVGHWKFNVSSNLGLATKGNDLVLIGTDEAVQGVDADDGATLVGIGSGYSVDHGLPAAGGEKLNVYTLIYDINVPSIGSYVNLLQTYINNDSDGAIYITPDGGFWNRGLAGSDSNLIKSDTWYRIVVVLDETDLYMYVDGALLYTAETSTDSYHAIELSNFLVFLDNNGEDFPIKCSELMLFKAALAESDIATLPPVNEVPEIED